jgi:hypothetical protein
MNRFGRLVAAGGLAFTLALVPQAEAKRSKRKRGSARHDDDYASAPSYKYGKLSAKACFAALEKRKIAFEKEGETRGVLAPVRIPKGLRGVRFHTALPPDEGKKSPWEIFDCRLVLALDDFAKILSEHAIDDVLIFSAYRPNRRHPKGKPAKRHPGGLAVDIAKLGGPAEDGDDKKPRWLNVKKDWHGRIGDQTCGEKAAKPRKKTEAATELRTIICRAASERLFTSMLTPNYDRAHHNHFHLEVTPDVKWRLVR